MASRRTRTSRSRSITDGLYDRDLDPIADPRVRSGLRFFEEPIEWHQRLIANPFLAVFATIVWAMGLRYSIRIRTLMLFLPMLASLGVVVFLFEFHCLDCGRTGRVYFSRKHRCERVESRRGQGRSLGSLWPSAYRQTVFWIIALLVAGYFFAFSH